MLTLHTFGSAMRRLCLLGLSALVLTGVHCGGTSEQPAADGWISIFNGKDLDGWTPKITGYELGDNFGNTFRVEDGVIKVSYDQYDKFDGKFGHLFYKEKVSNYRLRVEYRFVGKQVSEGPGWAFRNSGIMLHCQNPATMAVDQKFPVSIEAQMLGGDGTEERQTGSVCTPGTNIVLNGELEKTHCITSSSKTFHGDQWVTMEVEVHGNGIVKHIINGDVVMEYEQAQYDEGGCRCPEIDCRSEPDGFRRVFLPAGGKPSCGIS